MSHKILSLGRGGEEHAMLDKPTFVSWTDACVGSYKLEHTAEWMCWGRLQRFASPILYVE